MVTIDPATPEGRAHIRAIAVDAPADRAMILTQENVAVLLDAIEHATQADQNAAQDALEAFRVHAETQMGLATSHAAREAWNSVAQAAHDCQDVHHPKESRR